MGHEAEVGSFELLATDLAGMARALLGQSSVQDTLDSIVVHAVKLVDGCEAASVLVVNKQVVSIVAASHDVARWSDEAQGKLRQGPCFDAASGGEQVYRIDDLNAQTSRWPEYTMRARELGIGSAMGFLLYTDDRDNLGALNMYSSRPGAFNPRAGHMGWIVASHAAVALSSARHAENMDFALASSRLIGEAIGIVMCRYRLTEDAAFAAIREASQRHNVKVRELAERITLTGELAELP